MKWQKAIDKINADKYRIPEGWDTKEQIAEELQCSPDRVHDLLKGGVASGDFEAKEFPVWDAKRRMTVRVRCYRQKSDPVVPVKDNTKIEERVRASIARNPKHSDERIRSNIRGSSLEMIRRIRSEK